MIPVLLTTLLFAFAKDTNDARRHAQVQKLREQLGFPPDRVYLGGPVGPNTGTPLMRFPDGTTIVRLDTPPDFAAIGMAMGDSYIGGEVSKDIGWRNSVMTGWNSQWMKIRDAGHVPFAMLYPDTRVVLAWILHKDYVQPGSGLQVGSIGSAVAMPCGRDEIKYEDLPRHYRIKLLHFIRQIEEITDKPLRLTSRILALPHLKAGTKEMKGIESLQVRETTYPLHYEYSAALRDYVNLNIRKRQGAEWTGLDDEDEDEMTHLEDGIPVVESTFSEKMLGGLWDWIYEMGYDANIQDDTLTVQVPQSELEFLLRGTSPLEISVVFPRRALDWRSSLEEWEKLRDLETGYVPVHWSHKKAKKRGLPKPSLAIQWFIRGANGTVGPISFESDIVDHILEYTEISRIIKQNSKRLKALYRQSAEVPSTLLVPREELVRTSWRASLYGPTGSSES